MSVASSRISNAALLLAGGGPQGWETALGYLASHPAPGYLGVDIRDVSDEQAGRLKLKEARGAEVVRVDHDGPAGKCGLREHDVILQMNGRAVQGQEQLRGMLRDTPAGHEAVLVISRDGVQQTLSTHLANRTDVEREAWQQHFTVPEPDAAPVVIQGSVATGSASPAGAPPSAETARPIASNGFLSGTVGSASSHTHSFIGSLISGSAYTGALVETMGPQLAAFLGVEQGGLVVHSVDANSPAATAGMQPGDIVLRANTLSVNSTSRWMKIMHENKGRPVAVVVLREKKEQALTLTPDAKRRSAAESPSHSAPAIPGYSLR